MHRELTQSWRAQGQTSRALGSSRKLVAQLSRTFWPLRTEVWRFRKIRSFLLFRRAHHPKKHLRPTQAPRRSRVESSRQVLKCGCWSARITPSLIFSRRYMDGAVAQRQTGRSPEVQVVWESIAQTGQ